MKTIRHLALFLFLLCVTFSLSAQSSAKHPLTIDDFQKFQDVEGPQCSPDGQWIAYTASFSDFKADERRSSLWMVSWDGKQNIRLTYGDHSADTPRWSPDGKSLAFLAARGADDKSQVWLLDRRGGEARQLTNVKQDIYDFQWSPDGKKFLLVMRGSGTEDDKPKPIVIDRYQFKQDVQGYITAETRRHLYLFDIQTQKLDPLTTDKNFDDHDPAWSPDGTRIAFVSNHQGDPDQNMNNDIFLIEPRAGATAVKLLSAFAPNDQDIHWSPDGRQIAYLVGSGQKDYAYSQDKLAVVTVEGAASRVITEKLDRMVSAPEFSADGKSLTFMVADDLVQYPARIGVSGGSLERLLKGDMAVTEQCRGGDHTAIVLSTDSAPPEIYALEGTSARKLSSQNDDLLSQLQLGVVENISGKSSDGVEIHGLLVKPLNYESGKKYPTILWIHGGPNMQDDHSLAANLYALQLERQLFAANGYAVLAANYRGSSGRGADFSRAIFADWGDKEVADLLAIVNAAVQLGIADPQHLGIGGWSYGGILTDYTIATDPRFKAAASGAGSANQLSMYGMDQYAMQYNTELGAPWKNTDLWLKVSYPFFHADRIKTPTFFLGGEKDFNVPIAGGEQMYQALRTMGIPTQLVIYPGQFHIFTRPSFIKDRQQRWLAWFNKYLQPAM